MSTIKPRRGTTTPGPATLLENELAVDTTNKRIFIGAADGSGILIGSANKLSDFAATTSAELRGVISDETGSGVLVFATSPSFTTGINAASTTMALFNTTATTINFGGAATTLTMGATSGTTTTIRGGTLVGNTTTQSVFNTTATTINAFGAATTSTIGYNSTATSTTNISTGAVGSGNTKFINIGTNSAGSSVTNITLGSSLGTSTILALGTVRQFGSVYEIYSSMISSDYIFMGSGKGGSKGIGVYADDPVLSPVILTIDNQDGGGEIKIFGFAGHDYTVGYIYCDTPVFIAGDVMGNSNGYSIELNDNTGIFTVAADQLYMNAPNSRIKFSDGSEQVTKTPDYLLFDMGIV